MKNRVDYTGIALLYMARKKYAEADELMIELCDHLKVPEDYRCNIWDYIIKDDTPIHNIKKYVEGWRKKKSKLNHSKSRQEEQK